MNNISNHNLNDITTSGYNLSDNKSLERVINQLNKLRKDFDEFVEEYRKSKKEEEMFYKYWTDEFMKLDDQIQK